MKRCIFDKGAVDVAHSYVAGTMNPDHLNSYKSHLSTCNSCADLVFNEIFDRDLIPSKLYKMMTTAMSKRDYTLVPKFVSRLKQMKVDEIKFPLTEIVEKTMTQLGIYRYQELFESV